MNWSVFESRYAAEFGAIHADAKPAFQAYVGSDGIDGGLMAQAIDALTELPDHNGRYAKRPTLKQIRQAYEAAYSGDMLRGSHHGPRCQMCEGSGIVFLLVEREPNGKLQPIPRDTVTPALDVCDTTFPCSCAVGNERNAWARNWGYSDDCRRRVHRECWGRTRLHDMEVHRQLCQTAALPLLEQEADEATGERRRMLGYRIDMLRKLGDSLNADKARQLATSILSAPHGPTGHTRERAEVVDDHRLTRDRNTTTRQLADAGAATQEGRNHA